MNSSIALLAVLFLFSGSQAAANEVVRRICSRTSNYDVCEKTLYSDSRMADADQFTVAYITVWMTFTKANETRNRIVSYLGDQQLALEDVRVLERCSDLYGTAVSALGTACNDLNAESFFELADLAVVASRAADDCEAAPLENAQARLPPDVMAGNYDLKALCQICTVIGKMYSGEP